MNTVVPFRRDITLMSRIYKNCLDVIDVLKPSLPVYTLDTSLICETATHFMAEFPGKSLFAVKTNPNRDVIKALRRAGMMQFDVASIPEIELVRECAGDADIYFMHTVKAPEHIRAAYFDYGVRNFSLDHEDEFEKILRATDHAQDLNLFVRVALAKNDAASIDFSAKFGICVQDAPALLKRVRGSVQKLGVCFHVGTQTTDAAAFGNAINQIKCVISDSGVDVDVLDIGGGFPVPYDRDVPSITNCIDVIKCALGHADLEHMDLIAEPGRCLVAQSGSLIVRVELRKGDVLYINDGTYGGLFDAGPLLRTPFPVCAMRLDGSVDGGMRAFRFAGPTCDSLDMMEGPFMLPDGIQTGDYIEIKNTGAYSQSLRTGFNGFDACETVLIER